MEYHVTVRAAGLPLSTDQLAPEWAKRIFQLEFTITELAVVELDTGMELMFMIEAPSASSALRKCELALGTYYRENPDIEKLVRSNLVRREWRVELVSGLAV